MPMEKTFNAAEAEPRITAMWEEKGAFAAGANKSRDTSFCVMIPPPNVTGALHMGHAFNNTLQDILTRWHRMRGFDTLWQPGTDHAGIATQMVTEREMAANGEPPRRDMGREAFLERVWQQKIKSRGTIIGQLKRLGASCDWSREAFTMSGAPGAPAGEEGNFHDAVIKVFVDLYNKGLIYRGKRLVNWDPHFETAISDLEVENIEMPGHMWHFKYPLATNPETGERETYRYIEKDAEGTVIVDEIRDYISIATTRPETMLGDGAVAVHPSDERYAPIVGKLCEIPVGPKEHRRLIPIITDEYPDPTFGSGAVKITGAHDFNDYAVAKRGNIPCYRLMDTRAQMRADGAPYAEAATIAGAVARGEQQLSEAEVDALNLVPDELRGLDRYEARTRVVDQITAEGLAVMIPAPPAQPRPGNDPGPQADTGTTPDDEVPGQARDGVEMVPYVEAKPIMQPFGDRSKVVIEPMLTDQWFVDTAKIVEPALEAVRNGTTKIIPESGEKVYFHWLENIEPWCISRQLWWGHQIPVWYGPKIKVTNGKVVPQHNVVDVQQKATQALGFQGDPERFCFTTEVGAKAAAAIYAAQRLGENPNKIIVFRLDTEDGGQDLLHIQQRYNLNLSKALSYELLAGPKKMPDGHWLYGLTRDPDVLDTWFSSGLWPIGTLGWPEQTPELQRYFPTSVLVTGQDILFFWVARMMMMQLAVVDQVPFHTVYLHGLVRDAKGKKMSKSLGNVIDPLEIIDEYGADALRFTNAAMASLGGVLKLDTARIAGYRNFTTKLWNACRFAEINNVWEGHETQSTPPTATATANRWIIGETVKCLHEVDAALAEYRFDQAADTLYKFVWGKVCDWYVEFAKPLFDGDSAAETRATMGWVLDHCMILLHPIMPFITEELWQITGKRAAPLALTDWPDLPEALIDAPSMREMTWVTGLIDAIRSARAQMHVPAKLKVTLLRIGLDDTARAACDHNAGLIARLARIETVTDAATVPKGALTIAAEGGTFAIPLEGLIDIAEEKARLEKTLAKLEKDLAGLRARLANPKFIESAKEEVVGETREKLAQGEDEAATLSAALARLAEML